MFKTKALITLSEILKKTLIKALKKKVVIKEIKKIIICRNNKSRIIILLKRFKNKN